MSGQEGVVAVAELLIRNQLGMHIRSCGMFVAIAGKFKSQVFVSRDGQDEVNGKSILGLISLAAESGVTIRVRTEGPDADAMLAALKELVDGKFGGEP
ncbi:MAG: HPr family phosphocarrier protein [Candidatus Eiseniibacteriota bacterium]